MNETLLRTLKTACSEAEILDALARLVYKVHGDGEPEIPTVEALSGWLPMAPEKARVEAGELLKQLPWPRMILGRFESAVLPLFARRTKETGQLLPELLPARFVSGRLRAGAARPAGQGSAFVGVLDRSFA